MLVKRALILISVSMLVLVASCNVPAGLIPARPDMEATMTARAVALQNIAVASTVAIPVTGNTSTPTAVSVTVNTNTNCRTGPGSSFDLVFTAKAGSSFEVVGKYTPVKYWIINNPNGGTCWLWGEFSVVTGDTAALPEYPAPGTGTRPAATTAPTSFASGKPVLPGLTFVVPVLPAAPSNLNASRTCAGSFSGFTPIWREDVTLTWTDSQNDAGYRVYQNGSLVSTLRANSTSYHLQLRYNQSLGAARDTFAVEAFNDTGASGRIALDIPHCP